MRARSTLHTIVRTAPVSGHVEAVVADDRLDLSSPVTGRLELPIVTLRGDSAFDAELQRRLDADRYPVVVAELHKAVARGPSGSYRMTGDLSLHGHTVRVDGDAKVRVHGQRLLLEGALVLDVREFGITPPKLLLLRVDPQVHVSLRLSAVAGVNGQRARPATQVT